jgi:hypothetical protein
LVCGEIAAIAQKHDKLQLRGGVTSDVPLVSFNVEAFQKYGWARNENAPVCQMCMISYVEGLRRLTKPSYHISSSDKTVTSLSTVLTDDTTAVY